MTAGGASGTCLGRCPGAPALGCPFGTDRWARMRARYPHLSDSELLAMRLRAIAVPRLLGAGR